MTARGEAVDLSHSWAACAWPQVAPRLAAILRLRGVASADGEDIVQEVAERALAKGVRFDSLDRFSAWARVVGVRLSIAEHRRRLKFSGQPPEGADGSDLDVRVEDRTVLEDTLRHLESLSPSDREVLLYEVLGRPAWDQLTRARMDVRRTRARRRLRALVEGAGAGVVVVRDRLRQLGEMLGRVPDATTPAVLLAAIASGSVFVPPHPSTPPGPAQAATAIAARSTAPTATGAPAPVDRASPSRASVAAASRASIVITTTTTATTVTPRTAPPSASVFRFPDETRDVGEGGATEDDSGELRVCTHGGVVPRVCPVSVTPWTILP